MDLPPLPDSYWSFDEGPFRWRLGLRPLAHGDWIEIDDSYDEELRLKADLHRLRPQEVFAALIATEDAGEEVLREILTHLPRFSWRTLPAGRHHPLQTAGLLVQEDLLLLEPRPEGLVLVAASVSFPSRWRLIDKLGLPLHAIHAPVPRYAQQISDVVDATLARLTSDALVWRTNWSVQDDPDLFQPAGQGGATFTPRPHVDAANAGEWLWLRVERQTLRRLKRSNHVLFTIRTHQRRLDDVVGPRGDLARRLAAAVRALPHDVGLYKGMQRFQGSLLTYLDNQAQLDTHG